jgi:hypothetical protein
MRRLVALVAAMLTLASPVAAQQADRAVVIQDAPIYPVVGAVKPLRVAAAGTVLTFVRQQGNWAEIRFQDPTTGLTTGFIAISAVRIESSRLQPLDLSVPGAGQQRPTLPGRADEVPTIIGGDRAAPGRVFISADAVWVRPIEDSRQSLASVAMFGERATFAAVYPPLASGWGPNVGATVNIAGPVGVGVRWLWMEYTSAAVLTIRIPHPTLFTRLAEDFDLSGPLAREEHVVDVHATFDYNAPQWRVVGFGGPTYFHLSNEMVSDIRYSQVFTLAGANIVNITSAPTATVTGSTWGFNAGGDVSWFFTRHAGVGGGVLFNYGRVTLDDPLPTADVAHVRVGSTTVTFGGRFRF